MRGLHGSADAPNPTRDRARKYSLRVNFDLRFMDMAAFGAPQGPMLKAGTRRDVRWTVTRAWHRGQRGRWAARGGNDC
jgi:hypothetical protein